MAEGPQQAAQPGPQHPGAIDSWMALAGPSTGVTASLSWASGSLPTLARWW